MTFIPEIDTIFVVILSVYLSFFASINLLMLSLGKRKDEEKIKDYNDKVAIIIPVKDDESILNSLPYYKNIDYKNYFVVIVDDSDSVEISRKISSECEKWECIHIIRPKEERKGRKGAAINYALDKISSLNPKYVVVMDADHRPPRDFLKLGVTLIKEKKVDAVIGYQKHDLGDYGIFGHYYRISQASSIYTLIARHKLNLTPIFTGSVAIFDYKWLKERRFDETSITEDWELSLRGYIKGKFTTYVTDKLYAHCAIPKDIKWFINQQMRWAEGTISDLKKHLISILKDRKISIKYKIGLLYQGLLYSQALVILLSFILYFVFPFPQGLISVILTVLVAIDTISWIGLIIRGAQVEKMKINLQLIIFSFMMIYTMSIFYAYSTLRGLIFHKGRWIVTKRRS